MKNAIGDLNKYLPLTPAEDQILLAVAAKEQHGYAIMQEINKRIDRREQIGPATLYRSLKRLLDNGLIEETSERPDHRLGDERRRYYQITDRGWAVVQQQGKRVAERQNERWVVLSAHGRQPAWARPDATPEEFDADEVSQDR